jgi:predicted TIM-barrel fold metal-dependent hydrolase
VRELGWYVKIQPEATGIVGQVEKFESLGMPIVIDHMGRANPELGTADPGFAKLLSLLHNGNFWVMLSLVEKTSRTGAPWDDVVPMVRALVEAAPDRCIWGSDWPHPVSVKQPPNEGDLMEFLQRAVPDAAALERILVANPALLFGFAP